MRSAHLCRPTGTGYLMGFSATTIESMDTKLMADAEGVSFSGFPFSLRRIGQLSLKEKEVGMRPSLKSGPSGEYRY